MRLRPAGRPPAAAGALLSRYPGHAEAVAREYLALVDDRRAPAASAQRIGRYELLRELARGGQGRVYLARDPTIGRFVAVKILELNAGTEISRRERFRRELDLAVRFDHPHICRLLEGDVNHSPPYVAMELVSGRSLADLLALGDRARAAANGLIEPRGRTELATFAHYFEQTASAVHAVHGAGIVHRDLKPANLMVTPGGEPRVLDFGLARSTDCISEVTITDALLGTLPYMAPEQLTAGASVDSRADVFALGLTMLECATRERAFAGRSPEARLASIRDGVPWRLLRRLPSDLRAILVKALAEQPEQRYASCQELAADLRRWQERRPVQARPAGRLLVASRWCARHPWLTAWLASSAIALAVTWYAIGASREALAESRRLEAAILAAERSFDPWGPTGGVGTVAALEALQGSFGAQGDTLQRLAMVELRRGRIEAVRTLLDRVGAPRDARTAALLFACRLLERSGDDDAPLPELPTTSHWLRYLRRQPHRPEHPRDRRRIMDRRQLHAASSKARPEQSNRGMRRGRPAQEKCAMGEKNSDRPRRGAASCSPCPAGMFAAAGRQDDKRSRVLDTSAAMHPRSLAALLLVPLAACSMSVHMNSNWSQCSWLGTEPSSEHRTMTIACPAAATRMHTNLRADGSAGELTLHLIDPAGVERHHQVVRAGHCEVQQDWPVQEGTWALRIEPADFVGSYSVELSASDDPIDLRVEIAGDPPR